MEEIVPTFHLHIVSISGYSCTRDCRDILVEMLHDGAHVIQVILVGLNDAEWYLHERVKNNHQMYHTWSNGSALLLGNYACMMNFERIMNTTHHCGLACHFSTEA